MRIYICVYVVIYTNMQQTFPPWVRFSKHSKTYETDSLCWPLYQWRRTAENMSCWSACTFLIWVRRLLPTSFFVAWATWPLSGVFSEAGLGVPYRTIRGLYLWARRRQRLDTQFPNILIFLIVDFPYIWILGYVETAPRHILRFLCWHFEKLTCFEKVSTCWHVSYIYIYIYIYMCIYIYREREIVGKYNIWFEFYICCWFQSLIAGCVCVRAACGASATSKTRPWILEHAFLGFCDFWVILRSPGNKNHHMADLIKWLCQQDAHRNSVQEAGPNASRCFFLSWFLW